MPVKIYVMFDEGRQIGRFIEDNGMLQIKLNRDLDLNNFRYWALRAIQKDYIIDDKGVRFWIDERCIPEYQDGIEEKLKLWGMSEYDQLAIMHQSLAINLMDALWVQFNPKATFDRNHPRGKYFEKVLPMYEVK